jgi:hypothetical protein
MMGAASGASGLAPGKRGARGERRGRGAGGRGRQGGVRSGSERGRWGAGPALERRARVAGTGGPCPSVPPPLRAPPRPPRAASASSARGRTRKVRHRGLALRRRHAAVVADRRQPLLLEVMVQRAAAVDGAAEDKHAAPPRRVALHQLRRDRELVAAGRHRHELVPAAGDRLVQRRGAQRPHAGQQLRHEALNLGRDSRGHEHDLRWVGLGLDGADDAPDLRLKALRGRGEGGAARAQAKGEVDQRPS